MGRNDRQAKILELISSKEIETQEELLDELKKCGLIVTQATISRDIKEMGLFKALSSNNRYKYSHTSIKPAEVMNTKLLNVFKECVLSINSAKNLVVVKTISGSANVVANAIDQMPHNEILGCIAGDDTILIVVDTDDNANIIKDKFTKLINNR